MKQAVGVKFLSPEISNRKLLSRFPVCETTDLDKLGSDKTVLVSRSFQKLLDFNALPKTLLVPAGASEFYVLAMRDWPVEPASLVCQ